eukprot:11821332-Alexandrium_andersonii.AAC.1
MSASLVGSEMCIRDSLRRVSDAFFGCPGEQEPPGESRVGARRRPLQNAASGGSADPHVVPHISGRPTHCQPCATQLGPRSSAHPK